MVMSGANITGSGLFAIATSRGRPTAFADRG